MSSPNGGGAVSPGQLVEWAITATVSAGDNLGLAMVAVDLLQDASNPGFIEIPPGNRPGNMEDFDRPNGISNPAMAGFFGSAYGGTQFGTTGAKDLVQIGGGQNIFGAVGNGMGLDTQVDQGVGQSPGGQVIATGAFLAPCTTGPYVFSIDSGLANVLTQVNLAPQFSDVRSADILYSEVQGGCGDCDENHGGLGCSDPTCQAIVCAIDPFCCNVGWDQLCANQALENCDCEDLNSPFDFNVSGSLVCPLDIVGPSGGPPDGNIAVNDLLELLGDWNDVGVPADYINPAGVGKEDLDLLLYYWGVCPCTQASAPPTLSQEIVNAGLDWPSDWNTFMSCVTSGTPEQQENCVCWMYAHLEVANPVPGPPEAACPGEDPFCPWDCETGPDQLVGINDLLALLGQWGGPGSCDFSDPGTIVGINDLLDLLAHWGGCLGQTTEDIPETVEECLERYSTAEEQAACICIVEPCSEGCPPERCQ